MATKAEILKCGNCLGSGVINDKSEWLLGMLVGAQECPECKGKGYVIKEEHDNY